MSEEVQMVCVTALPAIAAAAVAEYQAVPGGQKNLQEVASGATAMATAAAVSRRERGA
jgi:hypothetical protein